MEFRQLKTFVTAAQMESFSRAAQELGYSQSAVTVQIRLLEEELGVKLFDRLGKRISLTAQGRRFLKQSLQILKEVNQAKETASQEGEMDNPLHIGTLESLCSAKLPEVLSYFRTHHPKVSIKITTATPARLYEMLDQNLLDLIYLLDRSRSNPEWEKVMEKREPIVFVTPPDWWGERPLQVKIEELTDKPFFLTEKNENYRRELDAFLEAHNLQLTPAVEISNTDFIIRQLKESGGISCLPFFAVEESLRKGDLTVLEVEGMKMEMVRQIFYHKSKWKTREMEEFIRRVRGNMEENREEGEENRGNFIKP